LDFGLGGRAGPFLEVDSHGESFDADDAVARVDASLDVFAPRDVPERAGKVVNVAVRVEPDNVGAQQLLQYFLPPGQKAEYFGGGKRDM
jgi:hypothetical protein